MTAGVLLSNLGTPDTPTPAAVRRYLREFLSDPRVVDLPRWQWWPILNLFVLTTRPRRSAELYRKVWTAEGSPLLATSQRQRQGIADRLATRLGHSLPVALGMRYGQPSIESALAELERAGVRRVLLFPLYPQYSASTVASTVDAFTAALATRRAQPEIRSLAGYAVEPSYVQALAASLREHWATKGRAEKLLISFHGLPERYVRAGDPYQEQCLATARALVAALELREAGFVVSFQSRFGREPWIGPATDETLRALAGAGVRTVDVICPGFAADCLETLEEIAITNQENFRHAGGGELRYVPALNDRPDHLDALAELAARNLSGWA